ncbi:Abi family protein [Alcaligenaceae bacterium]|nr:Abi family protein [Alcaligenaceae bacterium]
MNRPVRMVLEHRGEYASLWATIESITPSGYQRFKVREPDVFGSWLHALSVMRNTVAHHGRLLGAMAGVTPQEYHGWNLKFKRSQARTFFARSAFAKSELANCYPISRCRYRYGSGEKLWHMFCICLLVLVKSYARHMFWRACNAHSINFQEWQKPSGTLARGHGLRRDRRTGN